MDDTKLCDNCGREACKCVACEVCELVYHDGTPRYGCEQCGRLFVECCNSDDDNRCVECLV